MHDTRQDLKAKALLVAVQLPGVSDAEREASLAELTRLVTTLGFEVVDRVHQRRPHLNSPTVVGEGKLLELARYTGGEGRRLTQSDHHQKHKAQLRGQEETEPDAGDPVTSPVLEWLGLGAGQTPEPPEEGLAPEGSPPPPQVGWVVFDCDLSPSQLHQVQQALGAEVLDRTGVIVNIFSRHARSREARLQVEIARLNYLAPRIRMAGRGQERMGQGALGSGESQVETERRQVRDRVAALRAELKRIEGDAGHRRQARAAQAASVALVGYTNAGKSSLMRALTGSQVLVQDKLFATLDTTVRALQPEAFPRVLVSDTVGFIQKLPHDLVASFKSTLDEALNASLLLHVVDGSDDNLRPQIEVTRSVLAEIGAADQPRLLVLNKADQMSPEQRASREREFPDAVFLSAIAPGDIARLREHILGFFEKDMVEEELRIPYSEAKLIGTLRAEARVVEERYEDDGLHVRLRTYPRYLERIKERIKPRGL